ncbi:Adenylyltransferase and sulfurtransferase MOCS3 [Blattella germanica]|nr:Adenylyltransferase and sulfurtransferase MOCS3 [Blattella germanica]
MLSEEDRITAKQYEKFSNEPHVLIDVRSPMEFEICHLPGSLNIPLKDLKSESTIQRLKVFVVCRRGNDSQKGVLALQESLKGLKVSVKDIVGGLHSWSYNVDPSFPVY